MRDRGSNKSGRSPGPQASMTKRLQLPVALAPGSRRRKSVPLGSGASWKRPESERIIIVKVEMRRAGVLLRRHPIAFLLGLILFIAAAAGGYLYWDYAEHFQSTDDAFIAARQFAIAPKVSGYITAVPVTDNQHVNAGDVIARIDDRDYRIALDQAQAQVASRAGQHPEHRRADQRAAGADQRQPGAGGSGAGGAGVRAAAGGALPGLGADRLGHRSERPAVHVAAASAAGGARERASEPQARAAANRGAARRSARAPSRASRKPRPSATRRNSTFPTRP